MRLPKKLTAPYRFAPAVISIKRIDWLLRQGAVASLGSSGRRGLNAVDLVTFTVNDGYIIDQFTVSGRPAGTAKFVAAFNRKARAQGHQPRSV